MVDNAPRNDKKNTLNLVLHSWYICKIHVPSNHWYIDWCIKVSVTCDCIQCEITEEYLLLMETNLWGLVFQCKLNVMHKILIYNKLDNIKIATFSHFALSFDAGTWFKVIAHHLPTGALGKVWGKMH